MVFVQQLINGLMLGGIYISVAVAFTPTIGILNFLNFTIPALYMLAGMVGWSVSYYGLPFGLSEPLGWAPSLLIGITVRFSHRFWSSVSPIDISRSSMVILRNTPSHWCRRLAFC